MATRPGVPHPIVVPPVVATVAALRPAPLAPLPRDYAHEAELLSEGRSSIPIERAHLVILREQIEALQEQNCRLLAERAVLNEAVEVRDALLSDYLSPIWARTPRVGPSAH